VSPDVVEAFSQSVALRPSVRYTYGMVLVDLDSRRDHNLAPLDDLGLLKGGKVPSLAWRTADPEQLKEAALKKMFADPISL